MPILVRFEGRLLLAERVAVSALPEYAAWVNMIERCRNKRHKSYKNYGARGIRVCDRWKQFANFYLDMGPRPSAEHSIERKDNDGPYELSNCKWATDAEQRANRSNTIRIEYEGRIWYIEELATKFKIPYHRLYGRLALGWPIDVALGQKKGKHYKTGALRKTDVRVEKRQK